MGSSIGLQVMCPSQDAAYWLGSKCLPCKPVRQQPRHGTCQLVTMGTATGGLPLNESADAPSEPRFSTNRPCALNSLRANEKSQSTPSECLETTPVEGLEDSPDGVESLDAMVFSRTLHMFFILSITLESLVTTVGPQIRVQLQA